MLPDRTVARDGVLNVDVSQAFVDPDGDALTYAVSSSAPGVVTAAAAGARVTLTAVSAGTATIRVTATDPGGLRAAQSFTVTVMEPVTVTESVSQSASFTDDPIRPGVTPVRAVHFAELRARIDALRVAAGLGRFGWTDPVLRVGITPVRLVHLLELRQALGAAYAAAGRAAPRWTDAAPAAGGDPDPGGAPDGTARRGAGAGVGRRNRALRTHDGNPQLATTAAAHAVEQMLRVNLGPRAPSTAEVHAVALGPTRSTSRWRAWAASRRPRRPGSLNPLRPNHAPFLFLHRMLQPSGRRFSPPPAGNRLAQRRAAAPDSIWLTACSPASAGRMR